MDAFSIRTTRSPPATTRASVTPIAPDFGTRAGAFSTLGVSAPITNSGTNIGLAVDTGGGGWTLNLDTSGTLNSNVASNLLINAAVNTSASEVMVYYAGSATGYPAVNEKFKFTKPSDFDIVGSRGSFLRPLRTLVASLENQPERGA